MRQTLYIKLNSESQLIANNAFLSVYVWSDYCPVCSITTFCLTRLLPSKGCDFFSQCTPLTFQVLGVSTQLEVTERADFKLRGKPHEEL